MLSACSHPRVHRVRLAVTQSPNNQDDNESGLGLAILPTPHLTPSTYATRALLSTCSEARAELLALGTTFFPDTIPLFRRGGKQCGILRCNLAADILLLDALDSDLLLQINDALHYHDHHQKGSVMDALAGVRHLGLDVAPLLDDVEGCGTASMLFPGAAVSPAVETALVGVVAGGFPAVEGVYLLSGSRAVVEAGGEGGAAVVPQDSGLAAVFLGVDGVELVDGEAGRGKGFEIVRGQGSEWYTTRPFPLYYVDGAVYYAHLTKVMRFLCQFRQAMDAPAVVTDLDDQEGLERLEGVKLRLLGHYVTGSRDGLELSSPERCLEVALGREPRWVQWEWVCQCLDC
jgi:hypothetical protein